MYDLLQRVWLDNPVKNYLIVVAVILIVYIAKYYIAKYVAGYIYKLLRSVWKDIDKHSFITLLAKPLGTFLLVSSAIVTLHKLIFPRILNVEFYQLTVKEVFYFIGTFLLILLFIKLLINILEFIALLLKRRAEATHDTSDDQVVIFFKDFIKATLICLGGLLILKYGFGYKIGNLLTGLSLVSAAIAFAMRESIENLIGSFIIFFDKPFLLGDLIKLQNFTGVVEKIGLRSTKVRTDSKTLITIPNKQMVDSIVDNLSHRTQRRGDIKIELSTQMNVDQINLFLQKVKLLIQDDEIETGSVFLSEINQSAYIISIEYYTGTVPIMHFNALKEALNMKVITLIQEMNIQLFDKDKSTL